jgi:SAM-dependent methyltransferase
MKYPHGLKRSIRKVFHRRGKLFCPICESSIREFLPYDAIWPERQGEICPVCLAKARHRWLWLSLRRENMVRPAVNVLEFAPSPCLTWRMRREGMVVTTTDLYAEGVDVKADICALPFAPQSFDVVLCSMVLEHIADDMQAMRELRKVLKPGGKALITVPIRQGTTYEDDAIVSPQDREKHFGQNDHVRFYGMDIVDRLRCAGFKVKVTDVMESVSAADRFKMSLGTGIYAGDLLFVCT